VHAVPGVFCHWDHAGEGRATEMQPSPRAAGRPEFAALGSQGPCRQQARPGDRDPLAGWSWVKFMFLRDSPEDRWHLGGSGHRGRGRWRMPAGHKRAALRAAVALESPWQQGHRHPVGNGRQGAADSMARSQRGPRLMMLHGTLRRRVPGHSVDTPLSILPNYYTTVAPYSEHHRTMMIAVTQVCSDEYMHPR
jgi:hypothetical protein